MKTENLAIVFTDIVGYTESTSKLSRRENEELLTLHNGILFPIIRRFGGRIVKTMGDALLIVFRSPTDAMLCAMAMQDALFEHNRPLPEEKQIHIRVAASLGEVRLERRDIFGEPVNTTSRIESITPKDEIYLSDAVYMAMSKAEVPCVEVGLKNLTGISEPVRIWQIPRFSRPRLVPEDVMSTEDLGALTYPYGGAHLTARAGKGRRMALAFPARRSVAIGLVLVVLASLTLTWTVYYFRHRQKTASPDTNAGWGAGAAANSARVDTQTPATDVARTDAQPPATNIARVEETQPVKTSTKLTEAQAPATTGARVEAPAQKTVASHVDGPATTTRTGRIEARTPTRNARHGDVKAAAPQITPEQLIKDLRSANMDKIKEAAKTICNARSRDPAVLDVVNAELIRGYAEKTTDRNHEDTMSWLCKALGASKDLRYAETLRQVAREAKSEKLRRYAAKSLENLK
jgi:adenylate cyclase